MQIIEPVQIKVEKDRLILQTSGNEEIVYYYTQILWSYLVQHKKGYYEPLTLEEVEEITEGYIKLLCVGGIWIIIETTALKDAGGHLFLQMVQQCELIYYGWDSFVENLYQKNYSELSRFQIILECAQ